ncbi:hypothetical protein G5I_07780 [Acromyrmex echinatior]|uniref:Uncharacterized protein n=1 Tax=Acromyrmex echinatior TaxID=103372 RepID=F4WPQ4_ACREC|nr:hypothetical protein G5I_07780 [Acromyrmex echinatior]
MPRIPRLQPALLASPVPPAQPALPVAPIPLAYYFKDATNKAPASASASASAPSPQIPPQAPAPPPPPQTPRSSQNAFQTAAVEFTPTPKCMAVL